MTSSHSSKDPLRHLSQGDKVDENEDEDAPAVRLIATLSLVNVALPRLIVASDRLICLRHGEYEDVDVDDNCLGFRV